MLFEMVDWEYSPHKMDMAFGLGPFKQGLTAFLSGSR